MASLVAAMSRASTSAVSRANAFFVPSGLYTALASLHPHSSTFTGIPDECVDFDALHIIQLLQRLADLALVGLGVDDEDEGVVLLDLLHRALRVERVDDDLAGVEARLVWDRLARVLGRAAQRERLGPVEGGGLALLARLVRVDLCRKEQAVRMMCCSDTPQGGWCRLTPRRLAFAAALALAEGFLPAVPVECQCAVRCIMALEI